MHKETKGPMPFFTVHIHSNGSMNKIDQDLSVVLGNNHVCLQGCRGRVIGRTRRGHSGLGTNVTRDHGITGNRKESVHAIDAR